MRTWLLTILRKTCRTWKHKNRLAHSAELFTEKIHSSKLSGSADGEIQVVASADKETLNRVPEDLPEVSREALSLREMEGMSYMKIAELTPVTLNTQMSRRAQTRLLQSLNVELGRGY
jgi:RNA polymerase sigma factor (sigma-70 family)